jgi:hypothetical protein
MGLQPSLGFLQRSQRFYTSPQPGTVHPTSPVGYLSPCHPSSYSRSYLLHRHLWWISRAAAGDRSLSFSVLAAVPSFSSQSVRPCCLGSCPPVGYLPLFGDRVASNGASRASTVPRVSNFHNQLSDPTTFSSVPGERLFMVS